MTQQPDAYNKFERAAQGEGNPTEEDILLSKAVRQIANELDQTAETQAQEQANPEDSDNAT